MVTFVYNGQKRIFSVKYNKQIQMATKKRGSPTDRIPEDLRDSKVHVSGIIPITSGA